MFDVLTARLKHLPGRHDQSAHGRPGRVGTAFRGAYSAARAEGKNHREARDAAKTAAEQVREQMRAERREQLAANPKPKRVMPARVTPPPATPTTPASLRDRSVDEIAAEFERCLDVIPAINPKLAADLASAEVDFEAAGARFRQAKNLLEFAPAFLAAKRITQDEAIARKKEYDDAAKNLKEKEKTYKKLQRDEVYETVQPLTDGYMEFLTQMRHPNPAQVSITHVGGTPEERARAEKLISATAAMFPNDNPYGITMTVTHSPVRGHYDHDTRTIRTDVKPGTIVHEALHAMQYAYPSTMLNGVTDIWARGRTKGEQIQSLQSLQPTHGYGKKEVAYRDAVDNPYTLRKYMEGPSVKTGFLEVLSMAFTVSRTAPIRARTDKDLLRTGIEAVLRVNERWVAP
jgi:hypothetical protein